MLWIPGPEEAVIRSDCFPIDVLRIILKQGWRGFAARLVLPERKSERKADFLLRADAFKGLYRRKAYQTVENFPQAAFL